MKQAKDLNPELFTSERNSRGGANRGGRGGEPQKANKLSEYKIDDSTDHKNQDAAQAMYETIKARNPAAAEKFKKNLLEVN